MSTDVPAEDGPTLRQRLHSATGDRQAEAEALADRSDVDEDTAEVAVRQAHGDIEGPGGGPVSESAQAHDLATPTDARAVEEQKSVR